jgi:hypothetical protein
MRTVGAKMTRMNGLVGCLSLVALAGALGCSSGDASSGSTSGGGGGSGPDLTGVVFEGHATAAELGALLAAPSSTKATPMPGFTNPPPVSEYLPTDPAPKFMWSEKGNAPAGAAEMTYLLFGAAGEPQLLRVFTSDSSFQPTEDQWRTLSVGTWVTVDIFGGTYARGALQGDAAEGTPVQFCSMPPRVK